MAAPIFVIRRPSSFGTSFTIDDLGITIESGEERDLYIFVGSQLAVSTSDDLINALNGGDLERLTGFGGSIIPPSQAFDDNDVQAHIDDIVAHGLDINELQNVTDAGSGIIISSGERSKLAGVEAGAEVNDTASEIETKLATLGTVAIDVDTVDGQNASDLLDRANHTGTQIASTISDFDTAADARIDAQKNVANGILGLDGSSNVNPPGLVDGRDLANDGTKLDGIESGAEVNDTGAEIVTKLQGEPQPLSLNVNQLDGQLAADFLNRANHTGTQLAATISDFNSAADARINVQKDQPSGILSIDASSNVNPPGLVDGRDLATDGTKLDGIEAGAEVNDTASEIETKLQTLGTVGIDVDTVDGQNASDLLDRANHTGTQLASTISDFDTAADARITAQKGNPNGLATLDGTGKVPASQLPAGALPQVYVVIAFQTTPPGSPALNDSYIVEPVGTGAWSGQDNNLAVWNGSSWDFTSPEEGDEFRETTGSARQGIFDGNVWTVYATGTGDVTGPGSATDNSVVRYDGTTGKVIQASNVIIDDSDNVTGVTSVNGVTIENHSARHNPGGADALATAAPQTIGTANTEGSAASFARSDHIHNHGSQTDPTHHAIATPSANGFLSAADKTKLNGLPSSAVPTSRDLIAGNGLTGGGDLTADRTFDVGANADGSITVNANDIQVGTLATDGQHGNRGGGSLHADATLSTSGFMSSADKTKLDSVEANAKDDQTITAGDGLTGGGTGDVTVDIGANVDGSIIVNANDIQVGTLATDGQHGNRGGGSLHAVATGAVNGFMSAADKSKLDGYPLTPPVSADGVVATHSDVAAGGTEGQLLVRRSGIWTPEDAPGESVIPLVQRRLTSDYTVPGTFGEIPFDATDVETDDTVIEASATDGRIILKDPTKPVKITVSGRAQTADANDAGVIRARINSSGAAIAGSTRRYGSDTDGANDTFFPIDVVFIIPAGTFLANDYVSIEAEDDPLDDSVILADATLIAEVPVGPKGEQGDPGAPGGSTVNVDNNGVAVPNGPFSTINFEDNLEATDGGGGQVNVSFVPQRLYLGKSTSQSFSGTVTVNYNRNIVTNPTLFTVATVGGGTEVTCNFTGVIEVTYNNSIDVTINSRESSRSFIEINTGSGFTLVDDSDSYGYHRQISNGENTSVCSALPISVSSGDIIRVRADDITGGTLELLANGCRLKIERIS
jgi:hypothetical protein